MFKTSSPREDNHIHSLTDGLAHPDGYGASPTRKGISNDRRVSSKHYKYIEFLKYSRSDFMRGLSCKTLWHGNEGGTARRLMVCVTTFSWRPPSSVSGPTWSPHKYRSSQFRYVYYTYNIHIYCNINCLLAIFDNSSWDILMYTKQECG